VHSYEGQDCLAIVEAAGRSWPQKLAWDHDFYLQPVWSPAFGKNASHIAWVSWDHPGMPWDGSRLYLGRLAERPGTLPILEEARLLAGGEQVSVFQPEFSPDGRYLAYVSDESGWWHLYLYDLASGDARQLTSGAAEHGLPAWVQGQRLYAFHPGGRQIFFIRNESGFASLWELDLERGAERKIPLEGYTWLEQPAISPDGQRIALIASGSRTPPRLIVCEPDGSLTVVQRNSAEDIPVQAYAAAQPVTWQGMDGGEVHGLYYPPHNPGFQSQGLPPLIVLVHGGPTSQATAAFDPQVQFFTSRGFAVLAPNFRGSTGYGRAYRDALRGEWGVLDVQDCVSGALWLAEQDRADRSRLAIFGSSSGGFNVFQALIDHPGVFRAGIALYGVSDQLSLAADTHKFEAHYSDWLIGPLPQSAETYRQRSPRYHAGRITAPLALFHGAEDHVVPPSQSEEIAAALRESGVPHIFHLYPGEGHGFRKPETIEHVYTEVEKFLRQYVI
jgi:dipeptidyl aminopeptidase/acylaminoacyl peptidase